MLSASMRYVVGAVLMVFAATCGASDVDEFKVKRQQVFAFTQKPVVTRKGDRITVSFASKAYCDVTVAVEDEDGKIIRHLASGVLGKNAPAPFKKDSHKQTLVWDGKDDRGVYVDDKDALTVRVSLGLKPQFEKTLYWSPHKRISNIAPMMVARPEGVYVFEGLGVDHLRLFDHDGKYVRTIYPFPADKVGRVVALQKQKFPQDGKELPLKLGFEQATLLSSGSSAWGGGGHAGGFGATAMAIHGNKIALAFHKVNRLATDGTSGGLPIQGPDISYKVRYGRSKRIRVIGPTSVAFSPDGKYLYMTGYVWKTGAHAGNASCYHVVKRMEYAKQDAPTVFAGVEKTNDGVGKGNDRFCVPTSVATDRKGRVYVADYINQRIQVFSPAGKYLKTFKTPYPATVKVHPKTGEIWSFTWPMLGPSSQVMRTFGFNPRKVTPMLVKLGTFERPARKPERQPLPGVSATVSGGWEVTGGQAQKAAVDFYAPQTTIWMVGRKATVTTAEANWMGGGGIWSHLGGWAGRGIRLFKWKDNKWRRTFDFAGTAHKKVVRLDPPSFSRSRLYVNPATGKLFVCEEQTGAGKSFYSVMRIDPRTGRIKEVRLPFDAEDIAFDINGLIYMRTDREVMRFNPQTWREVPWDYGEERAVVRFASSGSIPSTPAVSALPIPGRRPVWWHSSGMWVSPKGHLAVINNIPGKKAAKNAKDKYFAAGVSKAYKPFVYPGRAGNRVVMIFDKHGKLVKNDAVPGLTNCDGLGIDNDDNLYAMVAAPRILDGKRHFNEKSETLMKFTPGKVKFLSSGRASVALPDNLRPKRHPDITKYGISRTWAEGAEWRYGGVGYGGQGGSCTCWHARFQLDYFARSFAPEVRHFSVAVLDKSGNLILRIGRYGNVDDGVPLVKKGGPVAPRPLGGDEVSLAHAAYVGVHTDRRLYIHDAGNSRILSVKLGYHATESIKLKDVAGK
jgi:NHL repeat-containing protein